MLEPKIYSLYEKPNSGFKVYRKQLTIGVVVTALILLGHLIYMKFHENEFVNMGSAVFFVFYPIFAFWMVKQKEKLFIKIHLSTLSFKHTVWVSPIELQLNDIKFIDIDLTDIHVVTNDQRSFIIDISEAQFSDIQRIKNHIQEFRILNSNSA